MPYITPIDRSNYDEDLEKLLTWLDQLNWQPGHVNYILSRIMNRWFENRQKYAIICSIMGTLSAVAQEFYRVKAVPYEEYQRKKNGDI